MKKKVNIEKIKIYDLLIGIILQIYFLFPWIPTSGGNKNAILYLFESLKIGFSDSFHKFFFTDLNNISSTVYKVGNIFQFLIIVMVVLQIINFIYMILSWRNYRFIFLQILSLAVFFLVIFVLFSSLEGQAGLLPKIVILYPVIYVFLISVLLIGEKIIDEWDIASKKVKIHKEQKKEYQRERRRRLHFPGHYSSLFIKIWFKDLKYRWRDIIFLFWAVFLTALFLFLGIGLYEMFSAGYGNDYGMLGLGLIDIIKDFLIVVVLVSIYLVSVVLRFYRKKRTLSIGIFSVLGIRSNVNYIFQLLEIIVCFFSAMLLAFGSGRLLLYGFPNIIASVFHKGFVIGELKWTAYAWTIMLVFLIALFSYAISYEIERGKTSVDQRNAIIKSERIAGKWVVPGIVFSIGIMLVCLHFFSQRRMAENIWIFIIFLIGVSVFIRNIYGKYILNVYQKQKKYIPVLPRISVIRHRYQTISRYIGLFTILNICILFFFCNKIISNEIADPIGELYPYDYVFYTNENEQKYVIELEEKCNAKVYTFPMVRATTMDATEEIDKPAKPQWQQGQNIGISENTYKKLKELKGDRVPRDLCLDSAGNKIYVVYQQDQAVNAKPIDWYMNMENPHVHIGKPLYSFDGHQYRKYYQERSIIGEERNYLTGSFRQGKYENIIVFSDEYFNQIQDSWKWTNCYTGEKVQKSEAIIGKTINEDPIFLQLVEISEKDKESADKILEQFLKLHVADQKYDPLVASAYSRDESMKQREVERLLEKVLSVMVVSLLTVVNIFLLHMKIQMDIPEMKKRYQFMECFGMKENERIKGEKTEISRFVYIPLLIAIPIIIGFTLILFNIRMFSIKDILQYGIYFLFLLCVYCLILVINLKWIQYSAVRQIENSNSVFGRK